MTVDRTLVFSPAEYARRLTALREVMRARRRGRSSNFTRLIVPPRARHGISHVRGRGRPRLQRDGPGDRGWRRGPHLGRAPALPCFHRDLTFEFHTLYFSPTTIRRLLEREGFEVLALRTYLRAHPLYLGRGRRRWIPGPIHVLGGLVNRGPCIEVIARPLPAAGEEGRAVSP